MVVFSRINTIGAAIFVLIIFSSCVQAAEGATYAVVPYVNPPVTGTISGIVGAGGNMGAMSWGMMFLFSDGSMSNLYMYLGFIIIGLSMLTVFVIIPGHQGLVFNPKDYTGAEPEAVQSPEVKAAPRVTCEIIV